MSPERSLPNERKGFELERMFEAQPELIVLSRDLYPEDTLGYKYFPEVLEGRIRPTTFAELPFNPGPKSGDELAAMGVKTLADIFLMTETDLDLVPKKFRHLIDAQLKTKVNRLTQAQAIKPHGKFIGAVFGGEQGAVDPADEPDLINAVNEVVAGITDDRSRAMIQSAFGLVDWRIKPLKDVGKRVDLTQERIRQIESKTLSLLRRPLVKDREKLDRLRAFQTLPTFSVGRQAMGLTFRQEVPELPVDLQAMDLSDATRKDLISAGNVRMQFVVEPGDEPRLARRQRNDAQGLAWRVDDFETFVATSLYRPLADGTAQELADKLPRAMRLQEPYAVLGNLLPEFEDDSDTAATPNLDDLDIKYETRRALMHEDIFTLSDLARLRLERDAEGRVGSLDREVVQTVARRAGKMALYLGEIVDRV